MDKERKVSCPWCNKETTPLLSQEKSEYGDIVVRRCSQCRSIIASYVDEKRKVLEKVRTFAT